MLVATTAAFGALAPLESVTSQVISPTVWACEAVAANTSSPKIIDSLPIFPSRSPERTPSVVCFPATAVLANVSGAKLSRERKGKRLSGDRGRKIGSVFTCQAVGE